MPSSFPDALTPVASFVQALAPRRVLDVGIGFGKYGLLFREYLDVGTQPERGLAFAARTPQIRIDGIEAHEPYVGPLQTAIYDTVHRGDALALLPTLDRYDLVFAADVLEHFTAADGERFLAAALAKATLGVLIVTPALDLPQGEVFGNPFETHRSFWTVQDFARYPGVDAWVWRRQLLVFLPADGRPRRFPRPTLRETVGLAVGACLGALVGGLRAELVLNRMRRWRR